MRSIKYIAAAVCLLALAGCARKSAALKTSPVPAAVEQIGISTTENGDSETATEVAEEPIAAQPYADGRIDDETDPNVIFHAEVTLPEFPADRSMPYCEADIKRYDPQMIANVFSGYLRTTDYETVTNDYYDDGSVIYTYRFHPKDTKSRLSTFTDSSLLFYTPFGSAVDEILNWEKDLWVYNADRFEERDFAFASREEAAEQVKDIAKALGIEVYDEARVYSLSADRLKTAPEWMKEIDPHYEVSRDVRKITDWRDCYYVVLNYAYAGCRITDLGFGYQTREWYITGSHVTAVLSADGIEYMNAWGYKPKEGAEIKYNTVITPEEAVAAVKRIYGDVITQDRVTVTEIEFYYMWYERELVPVYRVRAEETDLTMWIYIHGFTGERII